MTPAIEAGQPFALRELAPLLTDLARVHLRTHRDWLALADLGE